MLWFVVHALLATTPPEAVQLAQQGAAAAEDGRYADARVRFEAAHRLAPNDADIVFNLAQLREALGDVEGARAAYETYLRLAPASSDAPAVRRHLATLAAPPALEEPATSPPVSAAPPPNVLMPGPEELSKESSGRSSAGARAAGGAQPSAGLPSGAQGAGTPPPASQLEAASGVGAEGAGVARAAPPTPPAVELAGRSEEELRERARRALLKADAYLDLGRQRDAEAELLNAAEATPEAAEPHLRLANLHERNERFADAAEALRRYSRLVSGADLEAAEKRLTRLEIKAEDQRRDPTRTPRAVTPALPEAPDPTRGDPAELSAIRPGAGGVITRSGGGPGPASEEAGGGPALHGSVGGIGLFNVYNGRIAFGVGGRGELGLGDPGSPLSVGVGAGAGFLRELVPGWNHLPVELFAVVHYRVTDAISLAGRAGGVLRFSFPDAGTQRTGAAVLLNAEARFSLFSLGVDVWVLEGIRPALRLGVAF